MTQDGDTEVFTFTIIHCIINLVPKSGPAMQKA